MAIIRTGPIVSGISGAIGSVVFVAGRRSAVVRPRPITISKSSPGLNLARARFDTVRKAWSEKTDEQKAAWKTAATTRPETNRLGQASPMSAFQLFVQTAMPLLYGFEPIPNLPEAAGQSQSIQNVTAVFSVAGEYRIAGDPLEAPIVGTYLYYGWPFWTDKPTRSVPRLVFLAATISIAPSRDVRQEWIARFGPLQLGQQFAIGVTGKLPFTDYPKKVILRGETAA